LTVQGKDLRHRQCEASLSPFAEQAKSFDEGLLQTSILQAQCARSNVQGE